MNLKSSARTIITILAVTMTCSAANIQNDTIIENEKANQSNHRLIHCTYVVGKWLKDVKDIPYKKFNYFFVMAFPKWDGADFDLPETEIINRFSSYSYPKTGSGIGLVPELIENAHRNKVKVILSIGGGANFAHIADTQTGRKKFAKAATAFVDKFGYDGIDIDWEAKMTRRKHALLMKELRIALNALSATHSGRKYYLTTALHAWQRGYKPELVKSLCDSLDWINIMSYDLGGGTWGYTPSHNAPLSKIKTYMQAWLKAGFPAKKFCLGFPSYGFIYSNIKPGEKSPARLKGKGQYIAWKKFVKLLDSGWKTHYDKKAQAYYYFSPSGDQFITMDNNKSLAAKLTWIWGKKFRGIFWWELQYDHCSPGKHQLIDPIADEIALLNKKP